MDAQENLIPTRLTHTALSPAVTGLGLLLRWMSSCTSSSHSSRRTLRCLWTPHHSKPSSRAGPRRPSLFPRAGWVTRCRTVKRGISVLPCLRQRLQAGERPAAPPGTAPSRCPGSSALITRQHEEGLKTLRLFPVIAGARKRTYSLYEQLKSKINEAKTGTKNSPASEAAASSPGQLSPASSIAESGWEGGFTCLLRNGLIRPAIR